MNGYRGLLKCGLLLLQVVIATWFFFRTSGNLGLSDEVHVVGIEAQKKQVRDGGIPIQRDRVDDFIEIVSHMDFDQCSAALHALTSYDGFDSVHFADLSPAEMSIFPTGKIDSILADRRGARMYAELMKMDTADASRKASILFDVKLDQQTAFWGRKIKAVLTGKEKPPGNGHSSRRSDSGSPDVVGADYGPNAKWECFLGNDHALSVSLFLVARFCTPDEFLGKVDRWMDQFTAIEKQLHSNPELRGFLMEEIWNGGPDPLFVSNLMLVVTSRTAQDVKAQMDRISVWPEVRGCSVSVVAYYAWDAETNSTDFTARHAFVPPTDDRILTRFVAVNRWPRELRYSETLRQKFYESLRSRFVNELGL